MRNCMEYVLRTDKTERELVGITGPFLEDEINYRTVYKAFIDEKKLWNKDSGRMYAHNIISWHKDEMITLKQAFEFGKEFAEKWFKGFQTLIGVHKERAHVHVHFITNSISYEDGHKLHNSKKDLEKMKQLTNQMCLERGLTIAEKGQDFHGKSLEEGHVRAWGKDKYHLLLNEAKKSHVADCAIAVMDAKEASGSKQEFINTMKQRGWKVIWKENRKNITFENEEGKKVRDSNLSKTFHLSIGKEELLDEFERQTEARANMQRREQSRARDDDTEFQRYYREVEAVISSAEQGDETAARRTEYTEDPWQGSRPDADTESFLRELESKERDAKKEREDYIAQREHREAKRERQSIAREQRVKEAEQDASVGERKENTRSRRGGRSR